MPGRRDPVKVMQLVLIGGAQRSGTTLLQTLLANALDTDVLPEVHILCDLLAAYKRAGEAGKKTQYFYPTDEALLAFFRHCADRHIADIVDAVGAKPVLVLKDPNLVQVDGEAEKVFPGVICIICLRDPRDIAASFLRIGQREGEGSGSKYQRRDISFIGKKILASYAPLFQGERGANLHFVRYEEVVTKPAETLARLARDTGLALSLERIAKPAWLEAEARHEASWISELEGQEPSPANVGAYKTVMEPSEIGLIEQICSPYMAWAGYERSPLERSPPAWAPVSLVRRAFSWARRG